MDITVSAEFLSDVLGTTAEEVTNSLKDGEALKPQEEIESYIRQSLDSHIGKVRHKFKKEGYAWGEKESLTKRVKELKEKFGVEGETFEEVIDNVVESTTKKSTLNPDDVKNSEVFINETKRLKQLIKEKEDLIAQKESSFKKAETMRLVKEQGLKFLKEKNFVLPDDPDILDEQLENYFSKLEDDNTRLSVEGNKIIVLDANGRPKENETGTKEITSEDLFGTKAKRYFKQAVADNRRSPENKNQGLPKNDTPDVPEIKSVEDYYKAMDSEKDFSKQKLIKAQYDKKVEEGAIK